MKLRHTPVRTSGFAALEAILLLVVVALIGGTGYYVWHSKQATDKALESSSASSALQSGISPKNEAKTRYFTITEWGVRAPYDGALTLSYDISGNSARFSARQLNDLVAGSNLDCHGYAGTISRYSPNDIVYDGPADGWKVSDAAKRYSQNYRHAGNYYYQFMHAQAGCEGDLPTTFSHDTNDQLIALLTRANDDVKAITLSLEATE